MGLIYIHVNQTNNKVYVGQTLKTLRRRIGGGYRKNTHFGAALLKNGWKAFTHHIVFTDEDQQRLDNMERVWIVLLRSSEREFGYNIRFGGDGGGLHSQESRLKLSASLTGRSAWNKGRTSIVSEEHRKRLSDAAKLRGISTETRAKMANTLRGHPVLEETRRKIIAAQKGKPRPWQVGKGFGEEARRNMSIAAVLREKLKKSKKQTQVSP